VKGNFQRKAAAYRPYRVYIYMHIHLFQAIYMRFKHHKLVQ